MEVSFDEAVHEADRVDLDAGVVLGCYMGRVWFKNHAAPAGLGLAGIVATSPLATRGWVTLME
jgi:hypothetical protein